MNQPEIEIFHGEVQPSDPQLEAACDLFKRNLPVFDEESSSSNANALAMRNTSDAFRKLLASDTLMLIFEERQKIAGLLEWNVQDMGGVNVAYITWILVDERARGKGFASKLHQTFEKMCMPQVIKQSQKTVIQGLTVHLRNPALNIYRKWGYSEQGAPQWNDGRRLFMVKEPTGSQ